MEIINSIHVWIMSAVGGVTLAGLISACIYGALKGAFSKTIGKINVAKIADQATDKGIDKIKKITFTHNIQPLVESGLEKVNEKSMALVEKELKEVKEQYNHLINIIDKLAKYFDNSIGVEQDKKDALHEAVEQAKKPIEVVTIVDTESHAVVEEKPVITPKNKSKVER